MPCTKQAINEFIAVRIVFQKMQDVIVIGGGIVGSYAAYFLSSMGRKVTLVDRFPIGTKASGVNPGGLNPLHGPGLPGVMSPLAERAFQLNLAHWERIRELSGIDFSSHRVSRVELAFDEGEKSALLQTAAHYDAMDGFSARWMDRDELLALDPRINPTVTGGLWTEGNGMVNSHDYTRAVAGAAVALGATILRAEVTELVTVGHRVTGVRLGEQVLESAAIIIATGSWAADASAWLGVDIPVKPLKGELLLAQMPGGPVAHHVTWKMIGLYQTLEGPSWFGGTQEQAGFDENPTEKGLHYVMDAVSRMVPMAREATLLKQLAGLRPVTPDGFPIIDQVPGWENAYLATGSGPKGMLLGAGMAEGVACLVSGTLPTFSLDPYRMNRFSLSN